MQCQSGSGSRLWGREGCSVNQGVLVDCGGGRDAESFGEGQETACGR